MHIADGVLSAPVIVAGTAVAAAGVVVGVRRLTPEDVPKVAMMSALFFVGSLVHVPVGVSSAHLLLTALLGVVLGWLAFPAFLVALVLQALFFGFGGVSVLGVNLAVFALPAVACWYAARTWWAGSEGRARDIGAVLIGAAGVLGSGLVVAGALAASGRAFLPAAALVLGAHVPVMVVEGLVTAAALGAIARVKPELLRASFTGQHA